MNYNYSIIFTKLLLKNHAKQELITSDTNGPFEMEGTRESRVYLARN